MRLSRRHPLLPEATASLGGYTPLDVYVPILIAFAIAISAAVVMPMLLAGYRER